MVLEVTDGRPGSHLVRCSLVVLFSLFLLGCASAQRSANDTTTASQGPASSAAEAGLDAIGDSVADAPPSSDRDRLVVPLSLYLVLENTSEPETAEQRSALSSQRTVEQITAIGQEINRIWAQADIAFDPIQIEVVLFPTDVLQSIVISGDTDPFFEQVGRTFDVDNAGVINGFYVPAAFGVNGFTPLGSRVFFVVDQPSVPDARVSSHEVGHILGLHHELDDADRLMFSGTDGTMLNHQEQEVARYGIQGMVDGR